MARRIIAAGPWHARDDFTVLHREVLAVDESRHGDEEVETFVVTSDCVADDGRRYFGGGDYHRDLDDACQAFAKRIERFGVYPVDTGKDVRY